VSGERNTIKVIATAIRLPCPAPCSTGDIGMRDGDVARTAPAFGE
jgi:hypothetical protein